MTEKRGIFRKHLTQTILSIIFKRLYFNFESSGLGFPCLNVGDNVITEQVNKIFRKNSNVSTKVIAEICNSFIRILGDIGRYDGEDRKYSVVPYNSADKLGKKEKTYIAECAKINNL